MTKRLDPQPWLRTGVWIPNRGYTQVFGFPTGATHRWLESPTEVTRAGAAVSSVPHLQWSLSWGGLSRNQMRRTGVINQIWSASLAQQHEGLPNSLVHHRGMRTGHATGQPGHARPARPWPCCPSPAMRPAQPCRASPAMLGQSLEDRDRHAPAVYFLTCRK